MKDLPTTSSIVPTDPPAGAPQENAWPRTETGKVLPRHGRLDPLRVTEMLPGEDRVYSFLDVPADFQMPLRETDPVTGKPLKNWCGLHALWLMCHYLYPGKWNMESRPPTSARAQEILGLDVPNSLAWTALRVGRAPGYFAQHRATLHVNGEPVDGYWEFLRAIVRGWRSRAMDAAEAEDAVNGYLKANVPVAIDLSLPGPFREHVVFVYGQSHEGFIVIDSLQVSGLGYRKVTPPDDARMIMLLPYDEFRARWRRGSGLWHVTRCGAHGQSFRRV